MIYWFTGQPGSGKTTLVHALRLQHGGIIVDGDHLRRIFPGTGFTRDERQRNIRRAQEIARWEAHKGFQWDESQDVWVSVIAPYRGQREVFKALGGVKEIYCHTDELRGKEDYFVQDYEPPLENFLDLDTGKLTIEECLDEIRAFCGEISAVS